MGEIQQPKVISESTAKIQEGRNSGTLLPKQKCHVMFICIDLRDHVSSFTLSARLALLHCIAGAFQSVCKDLISPTCE